MSDSLTAPLAPKARLRRSTDDATRDAPRLLAALDDAGCRALLAETTDSPRSARELADVCDIPPSTLYRKLDHLTEVGLLDERVRVRRVGKHPSEYVCRVDSVTISLDGDAGVSLRVTEQGEDSRVRPRLTGSR